MLIDRAAGRRLPCAGIFTWSEALTDLGCCAQSTLSSTYVSSTLLDIVFARRSSS